MAEIHGVSTVLAQKAADGKRVSSLLDGWRRVSSRDDGDNLPTQAGRSSLQTSTFFQHRKRLRLRNATVPARQRMPIMAQQIAG